MLLAERLFFSFHRIKSGVSGASIEVDDRHAEASRRRYRCLKRRRSTRTPPEGAAALLHWRIHCPAHKNQQAPRHYTVTVTGATGTAPFNATTGANPNGGPGGPGALASFRNTGDTATFPGDFNNATNVTGGIGNGGGEGYTPPHGGTGGAGGASGQGGAGYAYTNTTVPTTVTPPPPIAFAYAAGTGGYSGEAGLPGSTGTSSVGKGDSGGAGGSGVASAYANNPSGQARAKATATGGVGGGGYGAGQKGGNGGYATIGTQSLTVGQPTEQAVDAIGLSAFASAFQYGGSGGGGSGVGAAGGAGAHSKLVNGVTGSATDGNLYLGQAADGGNGGGGSDGSGGAAGYGKSYLTFSTTTPGTVYVRGSSTAVGGSGGSSGGTGIAAIGANAYATVNVTGPHAVKAEAYAGATDHGGAGGSAFGSGNGAAAGTVYATSSATSTTTAGDGVTAGTTVYAANGGGSSANGNGGAGGAVTGATAVATQTNPRIGGLANAAVDVNSGAGGGDVNGGSSTHGGAGGTFGGIEKATAIGYSASASIMQLGGAGGTSGNGAGDYGTAGKGASSTLNDQVVGRTYGGNLTLSQTAIGGAGGNSDGGTAGAAGTASSYLGPFTYTDASQVTGTVTATGGAGGGVDGVGGATAGVVGGAASAYLNLTGNLAVDLSATATGGAGGSTGNGTGPTAAGGAAIATSKATSTTTGSDYVVSGAAANGGMGGSNTAALGTSGSQGGAATQATASAIATGQGAGGRTVARGEAFGGTGGNSNTYGQQAGAGGGFGNAGGIDGAGLTTAYASGYSAYARVLQYGGAGGIGSNVDGTNKSASGGSGAYSYLKDDATGRTHTVNDAPYGGSLTLTQRANGGAGGGSTTGAGGTGGKATSILDFNDDNNPTQASSLTGYAIGDAGAGGNSYVGGALVAGSAGANGADGKATSDMTGATAVTSKATAFGGAGGAGLTTGENGNATAIATGTATSGTDAIATGAATAVSDAIGGGSGAAKGKADATSTAITAAGQQATATSIASGGTEIDNEAKSTASTSGGTGGVSGDEATADATAGSYVTAVSSANINSLSADFWGEPGSNEAQNSVYAAVGVLASNSGQLGSILNGTGVFSGEPDPAIEAQLGVPNATILGYGMQGGYATTGASGQETLTSTDSFTLNGPTADLLLGLVGNNAYGGGFTSLTFTVTVGGTQMAAPPTFTTLSAAQDYFQNRVLDLGAGTNGERVSVTQTLVTSTSGDGFEDGVLLGGAAITDLTWTGADGTGLGTSGDWQPVTVPDAHETLTFNLPTAGIMTGAATGMNAVFSGTGEWVLQNGAVLTLAGEGDPLAITDSGNLTVIASTIDASGSIDVDSTSDATMLVESGATINAEGVSVGAVTGDSGYLWEAGGDTVIQNTGADGSLQIGGGGTGEMTVADGATVTDAAVDILGVDAGGDGSLTVTGAASVVNAGGGIEVGDGGDGHLRIEDQATVFTGGNTAPPSQGFDIAVAAGSEGDATVSGLSLLSNTGQFVVGDAGLGSLAIQSGAAVETDPGTTGLPGAVIANQVGSDGSSVNVSGESSAWDVTGALDVGNAATGLLAITSGATVSAATLDDGVGATGAGIVTVSGPNADLTTTGTVSVGNSGSGELSILNGANVTIGGDLNIANAGSGTGNVDIEDTTGTITFDGNIWVGFNGFGVLNIGYGVDYIQNNGGISFGPDSSGAINSFADPSPFLSNADSNPLPIGATGVDQLAAYLFNSGELVIPNSHTLTFDTPIISGGGSFSLGSNDSLTLNAGTVSGQTFTLGSDDKLTIGIDALQTIDTPDSGTSFVTSTNTNYGTPSIDNFNGVIANFTAGDRIAVDTDGAATFSIDGSIVSVIQNGNTVGTLTVDVAAGTTLTTADFVDTNELCFCAGSLIRTPGGEVPVERLAVGDTVLTWDGGTRPITWIGVGRVLATRGRRSAATPVIVRKNALADNVPARDLHVTKGHSLYLDGVLIPVEFLVNHRSILWDDRAQEVSLYHVELDRHDVMVANGAPAESYRDDGNRWLFQNANSAWDQPPQATCAPVLTGGPIVDAAWTHLMDRAGPRPGQSLTEDPDLHLLVDGERIDASSRHGTAQVFALPDAHGCVSVMSRAGTPAELGMARDPRSLGVALRCIALRQGARFRVVEAEDARLIEGFHAFEVADGLRWTDGNATLSPTLFDGFDGAMELVLHVGGRTSYLADAAERRVA